MVGDACPQEGVAMGVIQLAGHWKLHNLVVVYDDNQVRLQQVVPSTVN